MINIQVLVALSLFSVMRVGVGIYFPRGIERLSEGLVAVNRMEVSYCFLLCK